MKILPLTEAGTIDCACAGRCISSIHEPHKWGGGFMVLNCIHESLTTISLSCLRSTGTDRENSGPGLHVISHKRCESSFIK